MESKNSKVIAIVALIVAVVGLGIGFAAFSSTLTISSSATVTPNADTFKVVFDTVSGITCTPTGATVTSSGTVAETTVSGIKIGFTEPGQSAICTVSATNSGEYLAYLNSITLGTLSCAKSTGSQADDTLVAEACKGISVTVTAGTTSVTSTSTTSGTNTAIASHTLAKGASENVTIKIEYAAGSARADGQFDITVPDTTLVYSSVD